MAGTPNTLRTSWYDLLTGNYLGTVPLTSLSFGDTLNGAGPFSATVNMADAQVRNAFPLGLIVPGATAAVVDLNGKALGCWPVISRKRHMGTDGYTMAVTGQGLWWWFTKRAQATDYSNPPYSSITGPTTPMLFWNSGNANAPPFGADAIILQLIADMIFWAQDGLTPSGTDLFSSTGGIVLQVNGEDVGTFSGAPVPPYSTFTPGTWFTSNGGVVGTRGATSVPDTEWIAPTFPFSSISTIDSCMSQILPLGFGVGVDVGIEVSYLDEGGINSQLVCTINISYPSRETAGHTATSTNLAIDGSRARTYDFTEDSTNQGTITYDTGGTGAMAIVDNVAPLEATPPWPVLEQINDYSEVSSQNYSTAISGADVTDVLESMAASDNYQSSFPVFSGTIVMPLWGLDPQLGTFSVGDCAILQLPPDVNFPGGLSTEALGNEVLRITAWTATVPEQGDATVEITLNVPPGIPAGSAPYPDGSGPNSRPYP